MYTLGMSNAEIEYEITVTRKDVDTGIWHRGADARELIRKAQESVSSVYGDGKHVSRVVIDPRNTDVGTLVTRGGINFRYEITTYGI